MLKDLGGLLPRAYEQATVEVHPPNPVMPLGDHGPANILTEKS